VIKTPCDPGPRGHLLVPGIVTVAALLAATTPGSSAFAGAAGAGGRTDVRAVPDSKCGLLARLRETGAISPEKASWLKPTPVFSAASQAERTIGAFRFHYDSTGTGAAAMLNGAGARIPGTHEEYVDSAGAIFNAVLNYETSALGYASPIQPPGGVYDVTITSAYPYYGWTTRGERIGATTPARYTSTIVVDQDYQEFYTSGLGGLRVTAAHEFFHAIQFGSYGYWAGDEYFMEMTSTWMEDVVYDDVNDYYQYLRGPAGGGGFTPRGQFAHPDSSFSATDGLLEYSRSVFGLFVQKAYSADVIRRAWELMPEGVAMHALDLALGERGSSLREAILLWSVWNATTGPEADTSAYYPEGRAYPRIVTAPVIDYTPPSRTISGTIGTTSAFYYPVNVGPSAMTVIVANVLTTGTASRVSFGYEMASSGDASYKELSNGVHVRLDVPDPEHWATIESSPPVIASVTPAPNPFPAGEFSRLRFQIPAAARPASVALTVLTTSMERVFQGPLAIRDDLSTAFVQVAEWDGRDLLGRTLGSGVYFYLLEVDGTEHTGKFAVVR
jgi:hypothetical protein